MNCQKTGLLYFRWCFFIATPIAQVCSPVITFAWQLLAIWAALNKMTSICLSLQYSLITELTGQVISVAHPTHVFEVKPSDASNEKFEERRGDKDIIYAVHGSRVENFHSILNYGLQGHMSKVCCVHSRIFRHRCTVCVFSCGTGSTNTNPLPE